MRALLVLNAKSRLGSRHGDLVCRTLDDIGLHCERDPHAEDPEIVIAAGGDGTVIRAVPLALARGVPLAVIPLGTFNDLARTLDIPLDVRRACEIISTGTSRRIDVGRVNGTYFVNEASVGLSTRVARLQTPAAKQRFGFGAVVSTTMQSLRRARPFRARIEYDGRQETFSTIQLTIANNARFGGIFRRSDASIDDGWLDLYSVEVRSWMQAFGIARAMLHGDPSAGEGLRARRSTTFFVHTRHAHHIAADGEPAGMTPALFEVLPRALDVIVP